MDVSLTLHSVLAMLVAMLVLGMTPDASALAVAARAMASGFSHGLVTTLGIVAGDGVLILLAVYGLSSLADSAGQAFMIVRYLGAGYLLWMGVSLWRADSVAVVVQAVREPSWSANFLCGLLITLGDAKALLFYLSFLPAFVDLSRVTLMDSGIIMLAATVSVCTTKLSYAWLAGRARGVFTRPGAKKGMNRAAACVMVITAMFLIAGA